MTRVGIEQPPDHSLVLRAMLRGFPLEKFDAAFRERNCHFHALLAECELFGRRKKVGNDFQITQGFIGVSDFLGHKFACPVASIRHQRFE